MIYLEVVVSLYVVEIVRIMIYVIGEMEYVLIVFLDGKINIVIKVRIFERKNYLECVYFLDC